MVWKLTVDLFGLNARMAAIMAFSALIFLLGTVHPALAENNKNSDRSSVWEELREGLDYGQLEDQSEPKDENEFVFNEEDAEPKWQFNRDLIGSIVLGFVIMLLLALLIYLILRHLKSADAKLEGFENMEYTLEEIDASLPESDLDRHLRLALERNDYRGAIRVYYILTLRKLDELGLIQWQIDKTNNAYLGELASHQHHPVFTRLTITYEVVWYGQARIDAAEFNRIQPDFESMLQQLKHA